MAGEYGIAMGINQGIEKVDAAMNRRFELQQLAQQQEQQRNISKINMSNAELNNQILMEKVAQMEKDRARQSAFQAFDSFEAVGDTKYLNLAIKENPMLKTAMEQTGIAGISNIRDLSPEKLAQLGYKEQEYVRPVVYHKADGTMKIGDLFTEYGKFGYLDRAQENVINDYNTKVAALRLQQEQNETVVNTTESSAYLAYVEDKISKGEVPLSMREYGKPPKVVSGGSTGSSGSTGSGEIRTQTQAVIKLADLNSRPEAELNPLELEQKKLLKQFVTTDSDEKREIVSKSLELSNKFLNGVSNKEVTLEDVKAMTTTEALLGNSGDKKTAQELTDNYTTLKQGYKLVDNVNKLGKEELDRGLVDQGLLSLKQLLGDNEFEKLPADKKASALQTIQFNTRLGSYLADYIKSISGTAASDAEFIRLKTVLTGGTFNNTQTLKTALTEFVTLEDEKFNSHLDTKYLLNKGTTLQLKYNYDKELKGKLPSKQSEPPKSVAPTISKEQAIEELRKRGLVK